MMHSVSRRSFIRVLGTASSGFLLAACSAATPPQPTAAPAKPAAAPDKPAAPQSAPAAPVKPEAPAWQTTWDSVVAEAKKEGKVVVQTPVGAGYRDGLEAFMKAFPGIEAEQQAFPDGATFVPKIQGERKAGIFTFDVASSTVVPVLQILKPEGTYEPLKPAFILPEVMDDKAWHGGLDGRFADLTKSHVMKHQFSVTRSVYLNLNLVKEDEIKSLDDLLDPKWKGKIVTSDLGQGYVYSPSTVIRETKGEAWLRKLFVEQEPQIIRDRRQTIETLIRGSASIGFGLHPLVLNEFVKDGLANHVKAIDVAEGGYSGGEIVVLFNRAPHPNAAKVFINWLLSKEGQATWSQNQRINSARLDVPPVDPSIAPGVREYFDPTQEEWIPKINDTQAFLKTLAS